MSFKPTNKLFQALVRAPPLTGAEGYVHPELARRLHHGERHQVRGADGEGARRPGANMGSHFSKTLL